VPQYQGKEGELILSPDTKNNNMMGENISPVDEGGKRSLYVIESSFVIASFLFSESFCPSSKQQQALDLTSLSRVYCETKLGPFRFNAPRGGKGG
jgi:hypothetical protein